MFRFTWLGWLVATSFLVPSISNAQTNSLEKLYGQSVHAYNSGLMQESMEMLNQVVNMGTTDPRVYFFRGLTRLNLGQSDDANADFQKGAELEVSSTGRFYGVNRALERIQGFPRLEIERARRLARSVAVNQETALAGGANELQVMPLIPEKKDPGSTTTPRQINFPDVSDGEFPAVPFQSQPQATGQDVPNSDENPPPNEPAAAAAGEAQTEQPAPPADDANDPFAPPAKSENDPFAPKGAPEPAKPQEKPASKPGPKDDPFGGQ